MKKIINGTVYDDREAANLCSVAEPKKVGIDGTEATVELRKTLMRMRMPKAGVLPHETFMKSMFDQKYLVTDDSKFEATGAYFFTLAVGRYGGDVIAIVPACPDEARRFMEKYADYNEYVKWFGRPVGFDMEEARMTAKAINDANDARETAEKDLDAKVVELAEANTKLSDANDTVNWQSTKIGELHDTISARESDMRDLNKTLESRNGEISALNEEISRLNAELENLRVVQESPIPVAQESDAPREVKESPAPVRHKKGDL